MKKKHLDLLKRIVETPSPTGFEVGVAQVVKDELAGYATDINTDTMGSVHAALMKGPQDCRTMMLAAHMDEIGLMVTYISPEGYLYVSSLGGVDAAILPGMRVNVHGADEVLRGIIGRKPIHLIDADDRKNVTPIDKLFIDLGLPGDEVAKKVSVGDPVTFAVGLETFGDDMAVSRAFDDKAGVYISCRVLQKLASDEDYSGNFVAAMTVQEEIGTRGAITSAHAISPDIALAFDVTHATDYPGIEKSQYGEIVCGKGPVIARGPNINPVVFEMLVNAAESEGIAYQLEAEPSVTGTDARSIQIARGGIPTGLISIPLRYMHTPAEVIDLNDLQAAVKLIARFAKDVQSCEGFVPDVRNLTRFTVGCDFEEDRPDVDGRSNCAPPRIKPSDAI